MSFKNHADQYWFADQFYVFELFYSMSWNSTCKYIIILVLIWDLGFVQFNEKIVSRLINKFCSKNPNVLDEPLLLIGRISTKYKK